MTNLEIFLACMDYQAVERRPNHEVGVWAQTKNRWLQEAPEKVKDFNWDWLYEEDAIGLDRRDYIPVNLPNTRLFRINTAS